ncbi:hypothetical protein Aduo_007262 [Ancylostoma duodenale]
MMRVQKEIKKRVAFTPNMTVSNIVEQGDDFIQRIQKHLAELHRRIKEVDHPHNIAQDEHEVVVKSEAYGENEALSRISLREKAYYSPISVGMGRNSAHWVEENIDENAKIDEESSHAIKEEQCSPTKPVTIALTKKRDKVFRTSESWTSKTPRGQMRRAAGSDEGSMTESNIQFTNRRSKKRTRRLKKKQLTDGDAVDSVDKRFTDEVPKMDAENFEDGNGLSAKLKLDADFENNLRSLEKLVKGPDRRRLAALGIFE